MQLAFACRVILIVETFFLVRVKEQVFHAVKRPRVDTEGAIAAALLVGALTQVKQPKG